MVPKEVKEIIHNEVGNSLSIMQKQIEEFDSRLKALEIKCDNTYNLLLELNKIKGAH